jgi:hypothetical protein
VLTDALWQLGQWPSQFWAPQLVHTQTNAIISNPNNLESLDFECGVSTL